MSLLAAKDAPLHMSAGSALPCSRAGSVATLGDGQAFESDMTVPVDFRVPVDNPRAVFSDGRDIFLSSDLRHLTRFSINGELKREARACLGDNGVEGFTGFDVDSGAVWAVSHRGRSLRILNRDLNLQRTVSIPRNEGIYFTYKGREYFIDSYNGMFGVHRLEGETLIRLSLTIPSSPFARDFLAMAYGYPFPVFYYKASHIMLGFDGHAFHRLGRLKSLDHLMYDCIRISEEAPLSLTISNNSQQYFSTALSVFGNGSAPLATVWLRDLYNSGSFCVGGGYVCILSHHQRTLSFIALEKFFNGCLLGDENGRLGCREGALA